MSRTGSDYLPFNSASLDGRFRPAVPGDSDPRETGLWMIFRGDALVLRKGADGAAPVTGVMPGWARPAAPPILVGWWDGEPVRVADLDGETEIPEGHLAEPLLYTFFLGRLPDGLVTLAGRAQQIVLWERKSGICQLCGNGVGRIAGTWGKHCGKCGHEAFPAISPCAIVLVRKDDNLLLIRKPEWPPGYYSLPSGFCDFGESLEECARREVEEETGILIRGLRYAGSQSWPFPGQLMIGFTADYAGGDLRVDRGELEDAAWFPLDGLPPTFSGKSLAGWMLAGVADDNG